MTRGAYPLSRWVLSASSRLWVTEMLKTGPSRSHLRGCSTGGWAGGCEQDPERGCCPRKVAQNSVAPGSGARKCLGRCGVLGRPAGRLLGTFHGGPASSCGSGVGGRPGAPCPLQPAGHPTRRGAFRSGWTRLCRRGAGAVGDVRFRDGARKCERAASHSVTRLNPPRGPSHAVGDRRVWSRDPLPARARPRRARSRPERAEWRARPPPGGGGGQREGPKSARVPFSPLSAEQSSPACHPECSFSEVQDLSW